MYCLLITSKLKAWEKGYFEIARSRFLEFTIEEIVNKFSQFSDNSIDIIKQIPCLFGYERYESTFQVGFIDNIKKRGNNLLLEYRIIQEIKPIKAGKIEKISKLLDIREWEINRTHWAIKDEDLFQRLKNEKLISENLFVKYNRKIDKKHTLKSINDENDKYRTSLSGFLKEIFLKEYDKDCVVFYRGHSNKVKYKLEPSLFRKDDEGNYIFIDNEDI